MGTGGKQYISLVKEIHAQSVTKCPTGHLYDEQIMTTNDLNVLFIQSEYRGDERKMNEEQ